MTRTYFTLTNWALVFLLWTSSAQCPSTPYSMLDIQRWTQWSPFLRLWPIQPLSTLDSSMIKSYSTYHQARTGPINIINSKVTSPTLVHDGFLQPNNYRDRFDFDLFHRYLTLEEIYVFLDNLATSYKDIVSIEVIGTTYERRPIKLVRISTKSFSSKPSLWIDAGIHPREWISISTALYLIRQLVFGYESDPNIRILVSQFEWYILPVVNPDGYVYTWTTDRMWRKNRSSNFVNCKGVDLNRNFDYYFGGPGSSPNPCQDKYPGPYPFSELETKAILNRTQFMRNKLQTFISMHSYDQLWMIPYGNTKNPPKHYKQMINMGNRAVMSMNSVHGKHYRIGTIAELSGFVGGGSIDWAYDYLGVKYAFAVELRDTGNFGFLLPVDQIIPTGQEMWAAVLAIAEKLSKESEQFSTLNQYNFYETLS